MTNLEENNIIDNFEFYIKSIEVNDFLFNLMNDKNLCKTIIDNNLYWKNINFISRKFGEDNTFQIFKLLCINDMNKKLLNEEMHTVFNCNEFSKDFYKNLFNYIYSNKKLEYDGFVDLTEYILKNKSTNINYYIIEYLYNTEYKNIIENNFYSILNNCYDIFELKKLVKENEVLLNKLNSYIDNNPSKLVYKILMEGFKKDLEIIKGEEIYNTVKIIIDELLQNENKKYSDIEVLGEGAVSYAFSIGSKVLKIGEKRTVFKMENNKRFLKPVLRTEINKLSSDEVLGIIEITEKVSTGNITDKETYLIYKELRDKGYYWVDCNSRNLGKLIRNNKVYFDNLNPAKEAINYTTENNEELQAGEIVIIDNDYIFTKSEFNKLSAKKRLDYLGNVEQYELEYSSKNESNSKKIN